MRGGYLGPSYAQEDIESRLTAAGAKFASLSEPALIEETAASLANGQAVGWFQGRAGPWSRRLRQRGKVEHCQFRDGIRDQETDSGSVSASQRRWQPRRSGTHETTAQTQ
jgi:hypothetical protein